MDRYVTGCCDIFLEDCGRRTDFVAQYLDVIVAVKRFRIPFANYYIKATRKARCGRRSRTLART
jgi:hypothetical protein